MLAEVVWKASPRVGKGAIAGLAVIALLAVWFSEPLAQDPAYHGFADRRSWRGIPHAGDVLSNLPFLLIGSWALWRLKSGAMVLENRMHAVAVAGFFGGVFAIGLGSAWYHWRPTTETLLWDRLPMAVAFMSMFSAVLGERWGPRHYGWSLACFPWLGLVSVGYWSWTESMGRGDLRFYALVQYLPMAILPILLWAWPARFSHGAAYLALLLLYGAAKGCEVADAWFFEQSGWISGHSLKHLLAAAAAALYGWMLERRHRLVLGKA
ncbi:MAG: alkaline phytoceramidase [Planctomycetota bacterium]|nr:MAG: alkaline phytoceramidase [Planctomycetota bacterium]